MLNKLKLFSIFIFLNVFGSAQDAGTSNAISDELKREFIAAMQSRNLREVQRLIPDKFGPNAEIFAGWPPLGYAASDNLLEAAEYLLSKGANPNGNEKINILGEALEQNHYDMAALLIRSGVKPKEQEKLEILRNAIANNLPDLLRIMIERKHFPAELMNRPSFRVHSYDCSLSQPLDFAVRKGNIDVVKVLTSSGLLDFLQEDNISAFHEALSDDRYDIADSILEQVKDKDIFIDKALRVDSSKKIIEYFIHVLSGYKIRDRSLLNKIIFQFGFNSDPCYYQKTFERMGLKIENLTQKELFLHYLLLGDGNRVEALLLEGFVDVNTDFSALDICTNPIGLAVEKCDQKLLEILVDRGARFNSLSLRSLFKRIAYEPIAILDVLLEHKSIFDIPREVCSEYLANAVYLINKEALKFLIEIGADLDFKEGDALRIAVMLKNIELVKFILSQGSKVGLERALDWSLLKSYSEITDILISAGADINHSGGKLLREAISARNVEKIKFLLEKGADVKHLNKGKLEEILKPRMLVSIETTKLRQIFELLDVFGYEFDNNEDLNFVLKIAIYNKDVPNIKKILDKGLVLSEANKVCVKVFLESFKYSLDSSARGSSIAKRAEPC